MVAQIEGFISRAEAGLVKPKSVSYNITPQFGGSAGHYWGIAQGLLPNHDWCIRKWRDGQKFHMEKQNWVDIAYTGGVCLHGYVFAGRGLNVRTAANGSSFGNQNFYAFVALLGGNERPNQLMMDAFDWWFDQARQFGQAGTQVRRHNYFKNTDCPGPHLPVFLASRHNSSIVLPPTTPPEPIVVDVPIVGDWENTGFDHVGVQRGSEFHLKYGLSGGAADRTFNYGIAGDIPLIGKWGWAGDRVGVGVFRDGYFHLRGNLGGGDADWSFKYGKAGDIPLVGDWNGNGLDTIGVYRDGYFHLRNELRGGEADISFRFGDTKGDIPLVGNWNGDGKDTVGIFRDGYFYLKNSLSGGEADISFKFGRAGDIPIVGDWLSFGKDLVGVRRGAEFHLRYELRGGEADRSFTFGR